MKHVTKNNKLQTFLTLNGLYCNFFPGFGESLQPLGCVPDKKTFVQSRDWDVALLQITEKLLSAIVLENPSVRYVNTDP